MRHVSDDLETLDEYQLMGKIDACLGLDGIAGEYRGEKFVCLAGSNEFKDWKINLQFWGNKKGYHSGFYKSFLDGRRQIYFLLFRSLDFTAPIEPQLAILSEKYRKHEFTVNIGGFSNGAAVALVLALELEKHGFLVNCVTWGQPKTLTEDQLKTCRRLLNYLRVAHPFDPVTYIPLLKKHLTPPLFRFWWGWGHDLQNYLKKSTID